GWLGVIAGSAYVDFAHRNFPDATVVEARNWDTAIESLLSGQVDAIYRDEFEIRRILKNKPALNVQFGSAVITDQNALLSIAICDTCTKLEAFINYHIGMTRGEFSLKELLNSELGEQVRLRLPKVVVWTTHLRHYPEPSISPQSPLRRSFWLWCWA